MPMHQAAGPLKEFRLATVKVKKELTVINFCHHLDHPVFIPNQSDLQSVQILNTKDRFIIHSIKSNCSSPEAIKNEIIGPSVVQETQKM